MQLLVQSVQVYSEPKIQIKVNQVSFKNVFLLKADWILTSILFNCSVAML